MKINGEKTRDLNNWNCVIVKNKEDIIKRKMGGKLKRRKYKKTENIKRKTEIKRKKKKRYSEKNTNT